MKRILSEILIVLSLCLVQLAGFAQKGLAEGDAVQNLAIKKLLNSSAAVTSFSGLQNKLTIVDFFATWCVPCIRALPKLTDIKEKWSNDVTVVLVSDETEAQLAKFIQGRSNFVFPVIVDVDNEWNNAFQPPALPYTVVVKNGKVLAITEAEKITPAAIQQWLATNAPATASQKDNTTQVETKSMATNKKSSNSIVQISQDYIYAAKTSEPVTALNTQLKNVDYQTLLKTLNTDNAKKAFWINLYNGYTNATLKANAEQYKDRNTFFKKKAIEVAGENLSLDDIEHGILRRSKIKWSLGYLNKFFPSKKEKQLRVDKLDYRIHFALNCGAKSCPPIAFYNDETLNAQLETATKAYLTGEAEYDSTANVIHLPRLMSWFRRDFGGKKGILQILKQHGIIPADAKPKIKFKNYDWTLSLTNFTNQQP